MTDKTESNTLVIETFGKPSDYQIRSLTRAEPYVHNGEVNVDRYRVTIEKIEEPAEVIKGRLEALLQQKHHIDTPKAIRAKAQSLGITLDGMLPAPAPAKPATRRKLKPRELFDYAINFAKASVEAGRGTRYPTFRQAADHFGVSIAQIERACENWDQLAGYMRPAVGVRVGAAIAAHASKSDWQIEAYED